MLTAPGALYLNVYCVRMDVTGTFPNPFDLLNNFVDAAANLPGIIHGTCNKIGFSLEQNVCYL